jgi:integrase/recombinase XerD
MKNVTLLGTEKDGRQSWRLLDPEGKPLAAFDAFANSLLRKHSINTRRSYCRHLAEFFDYLYEAALHLEQQTDKLTIDAIQLIDIIESYDDYLVYGEISGNKIAQKVHSAMPSPHVSRSSSSTKHASIRKFLHLSERIRQQLIEFANAGLIEANLDKKPLVDGVGIKRALTSLERRAIIGTSMLAGVISGGAKLLNKTIFPTSSYHSGYSHNRAYPFDQIPALIESMPTYRDKTLYALCAASGCRISEALQLLWDDVEVTNRSICLIDPKSRPNHTSYQALNQKQRDSLVWKGRATEKTLLIEPYCSMFFELLQSYLKNEYIPHGQHRFVFQYDFVGHKGLPYFLSAASSRREVFLNAVKKQNLPADFVGRGPHSLRHMYGTYLLNYFPRPNGTYGLPVGVVQKLMGHSNIKSTERYARHDSDLIEAELVYANNMIFKNGQTKPLNVIKKEILLSKLLIVEEHIKQDICRDQGNSNDKHH